MKRSSRLRAFVKLDSEGQPVPNVLVYRTKMPKGGIWRELSANWCCLNPPAAPTAGVVDDTANTFNWTNSALYPALADYEFTLNSGGSYAVVTAKPLTGLTGARAIGSVGVRVRATGGFPASTTLFNTVAYT